MLYNAQAVWFNIYGKIFCVFVGTIYGGFMDNKQSGEFMGLTKQALGVLRVTAGIQCLAVLALSLLLFKLPIRPVFSVLMILVILILCLVYFFKITEFRHRRYKYRISDDRIDIIEGVFFVSHTIVPVDRIHQVEIAFGPIDARFGVAKVIVTTAGSRAVFRFLEKEGADAVAEKLNKMIKERLAAAQKGEGTGEGDV